MIHYINGLEAQIKALLCSYSKLSRAKDSDSTVVIIGSIDVNKCFNDFTVAQNYKIEVQIPKNEEKLPNVLDAGHHIMRDYPHLYSDRSLCLATETDIRFRYIEGFDLVDWMGTYVENYYYSYEYYQRFGVFPFGERGHGDKGVLETYQEIFDVNSTTAAKNVLSYIVSHKKYRGHHLCPCNSGKKVRDCHKEIIQHCFQDPTLLSLLVQDYNSTFSRR